MDKQKRILSSEDFGFAPRYKSSGDREDFRRTLETAVTYDIGGANYFSGSTSSRGYYVTVTLREWHDDGKGWRTERLGIGAGTSIKSLIEPAARFSAKRLAEVTPDPDLVARVRAKVLENLERNDARDASGYGTPVKHDLFVRA